MRQAATALVLALFSSAALAQDKPAKEMESQSEIADRIVAEQEGLKIREVEGATSAPARAFSPLEGGGMEAPGAAAAAIAEAEAEVRASGRKPKLDAPFPWGLVAGVAASFLALVYFVRLWRRAAE